MMYVLYATLDDGTGDNNALLAQVEILTGNRTAYGYNTPINLPDIVDVCGPQIAISCLPYAAQAYIPTAQIIGIEMVKAMNSVWSTIFPDDSRPFDLLYYLELILSDQNTVIPNRLDYCGEDLGGSVLIPDSQLEDILTNLQAKMDALDYSGDFTPFVFFMGNHGPLTPTQLASWRSNESHVITDESVANPIIDRSQSVITSVSGIYVERPIADAIAMDQYVNDTFNYDVAQTEYYYKTMVQRLPNTLAVENGVYGYKNTAANWYFKALRLATLQIINDTGVNLSSIYTYLRNAQADFNNYQQQLARPRLTTVNQLGNGLIPVEGSGDTDIDAAGQAVRDAGKNRRAVLLRDASYVVLFDANSSGGISAAERITMENAVSVEMRTARQAAAATYTADFKSQFDAYSGSPDNLGVIITLYTS